MHFTIDQKDRVTIFKLNEARLDSLNAGQLKAEFLILAQPDVETLILDLSQVSYVDSAGLSALLLAERQQSAHGGDVRLVGVNENVKSLLRITQLDRIFPMYATVTEAIQADLNMEATNPQVPSTLGPSAPTKDAIRTGAIAAGGSLGAAALAGLIMNPTMLQDDDDEDYDDDDEDDLDDLDEIDDPDLAETAKEDAAGDEDLDELGDDYDDEDAYSDDDDLEGDLAEEDDDLDELDDEDEDDDDY
ncbi:MAG TPA: STAS domain-containing protein [Candidatus Kapabacteria bacterium]|nr:STAS domain-containing protein [Candidatus Kapabacteria bacterium]